MRWGFPRPPFIASNASVTNVRSLGSSWTTRFMLPPTPKAAAQGARAAAVLTIGAVIQCRGGVEVRVGMAIANRRILMVEEVLTAGEKIDFIFDEQTEKKVIYRIWDEFAETRPDSYRVTLGNTPRFENDQDFLPLQAADFWAWWARKWH
jgi:hypothetical protein